MGYARDDFFYPYNTDLICIRCDGIMKYPRTHTLCGHSMCESCWYSHVRPIYSIDVEHITCLHCGLFSALDEGCLIFDAALNQTILNLTTRCENRGCDKQMPLILRDLHIDVCKHNPPTLRRSVRIASRKGINILKDARRLTCSFKLLLNTKLGTKYGHKFVRKVHEDIDKVKEELAQLISNETQ